MRSWTSGMDLRTTGLRQESNRWEVPPRNLVKTVHIKKLQWSLGLAIEGGADTSKEDSVEAGHDMSGQVRLCRASSTSSRTALPVSPASSGWVNSYAPWRELIPGVSPDLCNIIINLQRAGLTHKAIADLLCQTYLSPHSDKMSLTVAEVATSPADMCRSLMLQQ